MYLLNKIYSVLLDKMFCVHIETRLLNVLKYSQYLRLIDTLEQGSAQKKFWSEPGTHFLGFNPEPTAK